MPIVETNEIDDVSASGLYEVSRKSLVSLHTGSALKLKEILY